MSRVALGCESSAVLFDANRAQSRLAIRGMSVSVMTPYEDYVHTMASVRARYIAAQAEAKRPILSWAEQREHTLKAMGAQALLVVTKGRFLTEREVTVLELATKLGRNSPETYREICLPYPIDSYQISNSVAGRVHELGVLPVSESEQFGYLRPEELFEPQPHEVDVVAWPDEQTSIHQEQGER